MNPAPFQRACDVMREGIERGEAHSAILAVANARKILRMEAAPSTEGAERPTADSIYLLASITKPFIGVAILQLVEQGRLLLSDPIVKHIPEFGRYGKEGVTIWHLMTHTSGMAEEPMNTLIEQRASAEAHLKAAYDTVLHFSPGSEYQYCNISFWVLGEIIHRLSGEPYPEYLQQHVMRPLGMCDTAFSYTGEQSQRVLPVHAASPGQEPNLDVDYFASLNVPAGGLCSTCADLVAFGQALLNGLQGRLEAGRPRLLTRAAMRTMTSLHTAGLRERGTNNPANYGLCVSKPSVPPRSLGAASGFGHGGATATLLWIEPEYDLVYVFLTNVWGQTTRVAHLALDAVLAELG